MWDPNIINHSDQSNQKDAIKLWVEKLSFKIRYTVNQTYQKDEIKWWVLKIINMNSK